MYKLVFKLDYTYLCWGIPVSSLSGAFEQEVEVLKGREFKLRHQRGTSFKIIAVDSDRLGVFVAFTCPDRLNMQKVLRLNAKTEFYFEENFEQSTDCNINVYSGTVELIEY